MTICKEYIQILNEATSKKKQVKKFFDILKRKKDEKNIISLFTGLHYEIFEEIDCLQCANCCNTVGPMVTDNDIQKMAGYLKTKPSAIVSEYLRIDEDRDYVFKAMPCPFLNQENHLCQIYESRPKACREYPHTDDRRLPKLLPITYKNTFICPAVYLIVKKAMLEIK